jgi:hypothetical protein
MKMTKTASGKTKLVMSKKEWQQIGKTAGWMKKESDLAEDLVSRLRKKDTTPSEVYDIARIESYRFTAKKMLTETDSKLLLNLVTSVSEDGIKEEASKHKCILDALSKVAEDMTKDQNVRNAAKASLRKLMSVRK